MATTNNFSLPYPHGNDPYNIPEDIENLAKSIDSSLKAVSDSVATIDFSTTETVEEVQRNLEILEQEINRAGLPNVEQLMVDIEEARKELVAAQEEFSVGQAELGVHLTNLRDERMPALEESVQEARNEMDTAMDEFMTRQTQFEDSISTAETEIEAAKKRLDTTETDVKAAIEYAGNAQTAAEAAESRAVEAMSFVSTVLQNGSFEDGLTNWATTGGARLTDDITRSGVLAGLLPELGDALTYDETLTAVAGQVWELSGFYYCGVDPQIGITFTYYDENDTALETVSEIELAGRVGVWNTFGPFRIEAPENSATMGFSIESVTDTGYVRVDDIALRDVTDVVRLEHAATAARQTADQALAELELMRLALDGPGGLQDRLETAENVLEDKAESSELPLLEGRLTDAFGAADTLIANAAAQDATNKANAVKTAAAADAQTKADAVLSQANDLMARAITQGQNLIVDGSFEEGDANWSTSINQFTASVGNEARTGYRVMVLDIGAGNRWPRTSSYVPIEEGRTYRLSAWFKVVTGTTGNIGFVPRLHHAGGTSSPVVGSTSGPTVEDGWTRLTFDWTCNYDGAYQVQFAPWAGSQPDSILWVDDFTAYDITEAKAALDTAHNALTEAEDAHAAAGGAWDHADAAMTRAGAAETNAKTHADNLPKVLHGTGAPTGTAPNGSIWWRHQGTLSGPVIGQWNRVNGQWRSTPIDSQAIANLDVGKLTAGSAEIAEAVLNKIFANEIFANHVEALEAYIGGSAFKDGVITTKVLEAAKEIITGLFAAEYGLIEEELVVKGKLFAENATLINAAMQNLTVTERANFVDAFAKELYAERFTAEVANIANLTVAARNLIPGMFNIANETPPPFDVDGYGVNTGDPSVWIQGARTVNTSSEEDALIYLEAGVNYKFSVETAASVPGTMYYVQLMDENGNNATDTMVELAETSYLLTQEIAGPDKNNWWPAESTFWVQKTGGYRLKIFANHNRGADNLTGYQWFRNMRVESMNDGRLIVPGSIDASRLNAYEVFANELVSDQIWANIVRAKMLEADEAIIGGALIKNNEITVDKLTALDEILAEMLRVRKIDAGDIAADAITADKIAGGAIDGQTITGATVRTAATGNRLEMRGNSITGYNSNNSVASRFTPTGISLTDGAGQLQDLGNHIYGSVSVNSWIGAKGASTPTGSANGYGAYYLPNNTATFTASSRQYRCDVSFNIFAHGMTVASDGWVLFEAKPKDSNNNSLSGAFFSREIYVGAPMFDVSLNYSMSEIRNLPSSVKLGETAIVGWRMRNKGLEMCRVSNVTITLTPV